MLATVIPEFPQVRFVYKDFPLTQIHPWAESAAIGARCAYMQSPKSYASVQEQIFAEQELLSAENIWEKLISYAQNAGLDPEAFKACMSSPEAKAAVDASHQEGESVSITSTPTVFVNGHPLIGGDKATLEQYIKYELSRASVGNRPNPPLAKENRRPRHKSRPNSPALSALHRSQHLPINNRRPTNLIATHYQPHRHQEKNTSTTLLTKNRNRRLRPSPRSPDKSQLDAASYIT